MNFPIGVKDSKMVNLTRRRAEQLLNNAVGRSLLTPADLM